MKIKSVNLKLIKRFTSLTIQNIPRTAKLVILAGPNGSGKSSLFDAMNFWHFHEKGWGFSDNPYFVKQVGEASLSLREQIDISFYDPQPASPDEKAKAIYFRSAYRNEPRFEVDHLKRMGSALAENRLARMIENDATVSSNYTRLVSQSLEDIYERELATTSIGQFREKVIGEIKRSFNRLFPNLILNSLGNPLSNGTFKFDKGTSKSFLYMNLSGGEKAVFDLIVDIIIKRREYDDTVFCIDEPEAHTSPRIQGDFLAELYGLMPDNSQLWLATHSIGMMRRAQELAMESPEAVSFLDFGDKDFDEPQIIEPHKPTRVFWQNALKVALDDMAELVAPRRIVICEGKPGRARGNDADCYDVVFADEFPETRFLSAGNATDVELDRLALVQAIAALAAGTNVTRLVDRDDRSDEEIVRCKQEGVRVLRRRHIESYFYDDEMLLALCVKNGKGDVIEELLKDKEDAIQTNVNNGRARDDIKSASGGIYNAAKHRLGLIQCGNNAREFMRATLAPLMRPDMEIYRQLREDIFGEAKA